MLLAMHVIAVCHYFAANHCVMLSDKAYVCVCVCVQYAIDAAKRADSVDVDAFVDAARTHGFGMWRLDCR